MQQPESARTKRDHEILKNIQFSYEQSERVYSGRRIHRDLREWGICVGEKRVTRVMQRNDIIAERGYKKHRYRVGSASEIAPNLLQRQFDVDTPDRVWVTDIT